MGEWEKRRGGGQTDRAREPGRGAVIVSVCVCEACEVTRMLAQSTATSAAASQ